MNCPSCGYEMPAASPMGKSKNNEMNELNSMVKGASSAAARLKGIGSSKKRPELQKRGITRGGRYARD